MCHYFGPIKYIICLLMKKNNNNGEIKIVIAKVNHLGGHTTSYHISCHA